jgi:radical SAM protein
MSAASFPSIRQPRYDVSQRPFLIIWEATRACDLACLHCRADAVTTRDSGELTRAEAYGLIDDIAAFGKPSPLFVITGGDPMKRDDLTDIVAHANARSIAVALSPSATQLVTRKRLVDLRDAGLKAMSLSLDGSSPHVHDAFRGFSGVFERTLQLWDAARDVGLRVQINTTVTRHNVEDLASIAVLLRERRVFLWSVFFLVPTGRGSVLEPITPGECEDVMHFLYDIGSVVPVKTTEGHHFKRIVVQRQSSDDFKAGALYRRLTERLGQDWPSSERARRTPMDVNAGRGFVFISHRGDVYPSGFFPSSGGNVRAASLNDIYQKSDLFQALRDPTRLRGRCGRCAFVSVCGGSRSRAYAVTGDPFAEDPLCAYVPAG